MTDDGRTVTEIRLRDDTQPSDFRVPLPATAAAIENGCSCPAQPEWPTIAIASDCPVHTPSGPLMVAASPQASRAPSPSPSGRISASRPNAASKQTSNPRSLSR